LEKFNGILIATTNLLGNIDTAFHRRFLYITEVNAPDVKARSNYLEKSSMYHLLNLEQLELLTNSAFTIAELKNIEQKIHLIQRIRLLSSKDLDALVVRGGMLKKTTKAIGYAIN
jgi:SpoVK/Ycf46/Vps4 family AAA+-type ATPase